MERNFVKGAIILAIGSLVSRSLGAVYRIILPILMGGGEQGAQGMALFSMAYPVYTIILSLSAVGIPLAISKMVSESLAHGNELEAYQIFKTSLKLLAVLGIVLSLGMFLGAEFLATRVYEDPLALYSIAALAPAVFFVSLMSAYRGYFQGMQDMTPHAVSQIVEQIVRIATMFILAVLLIPYGIEYAAAGATFGAVTGALVGLIYLIYVYMKKRNTLKPKNQVQVGSVPSTPAIAKEIARLAIPISLAGMILPLMNFLDTIIVPSRLQHGGFTLEEARTLFGYLSSYAFPFINVPAILTTALAVSLVPAISESSALRDYEAVRNRTRTALRLVLVLVLPAMMGLFLLAEPIVVLLFKAPEAGPILQILATATLFLGFQQISSATLQGLGKPLIPMTNLLAGAFVKTVITYTFTVDPVWNVKAAAWGTVLGFMVAAILNLYRVERIIGKVLDVKSMVLKPAISVAVMSFAVVGSYVYLEAWRGASAATIGAIGVGTLVYGVVLLVVGGITERDLMTIPRIGAKMVKILKNLRLLRS